MRQDAHVVVRTGKAPGVKDTVHTDSALAESARLPIRSRLDIHPAVRGIEKRTQLARVVVAEGSGGGEDGVTSVVDRELRLIPLRGMIGAQPLITFVNLRVRGDAVEQRFHL